MRRFLAFVTVLATLNCDRAVAETLFAQKESANIDYSAVAKIVVGDLGSSMNGAPKKTDRLGAVSDPDQVKSFVDEIRCARPQRAELFFYNGTYPIALYDRHGKVILMLDFWATSKPANAFIPNGSGSNEALICPKMGAFAGKLVTDKYGN